MSDKEKMIDHIDQGLAEQEESLRAEEEARKALEKRTGKRRKAAPPIPEDDDFVEIDPWENVYKPHARERIRRLRGEEIELPYDDDAPRPRQRLLERRERKEAERARRKREKQRERAARAAEADAFLREDFDREEVKQAAEEARSVTIGATREALPETADRASQAEMAGGVTRLDEPDAAKSRPAAEETEHLSRRERRRRRYIEEELAHADPRGREWLLADESEVIERREQARAKRTGKKGRKRRRRPGRIVLLVILIIIAALVASVFALYYAGEKDLLETNVSAIEQRAPEGAGAADGVISYRGQTYHYNENLVNLLVFGVGKEDVLEGEDSAHEAATGIFLWSYDTEKETANLIPIPTHLTTECPVYNDQNEYLYQKKQYLGDAYATGGTTELMRYQNVVNSVSDLLYGLPISGYIAIEMDEMSELNDLVGGISLRVAEDLLAYDEGLANGAQVTLSGDQARIYLVDRSVEADTVLEKEAGLIQRQMQYLKIYMTKLKSTLLLPTSIKTALEDLRDDTYTDLGLPHFLFLSKAILLNGFGDEAVTLPYTLDTGAGQASDPALEDAGGQETGNPESQEEASGSEEGGEAAQGAAESEQADRIGMDQEALFEQVLGLFYRS